MQKRKEDLFSDQEETKGLEAINKSGQLRKSQSTLRSSFTET